MKRGKDWLRSLPVLLLLAAGCAGFARDCSSCNASSFGSNWLVVQYQYESRPMNCWALKNTAISVEGSNGIFWQDTTSGNLVHVSGIALNRVQIEGDRWKEAAEHLGIDLGACDNGRYRPERADAGVPQGDPPVRRLKAECKGPGGSCTVKVP